MEHCTICHETFNDTRAGDKHREVAFNYAIISTAGHLEHLTMTDYLLKNLPKGTTIVSENNQMRYCLNAEEMRAKGMNQEKNGAWNSGGNWSPSIYTKSQEVLSLPA